MLAIRNETKATANGARMPIASPILPPAIFMRCTKWLRCQRVATFLSGKDENAGKKEKKGVLRGGKKPETTDGHRKRVSIMKCCIH